MHWADRRRRFRNILSGTECFFPASVFDPMSARIAEDLGFELGMFAGSVASLTVLGAPDLVVLTLTEFAEQAVRINRASNLPLLVDADHGYGNALNVQRTVEELETAGVAALTIEDTVLPTPFGGGKTQLVSIEEGVGKMRAAVAARQDRDLVIVGRTDMALAGIEGGTARAKAYQETGVDAIFLGKLKAREEIEAISAAVRIPLILGNVPASLADREYLAGQRVRVCLRGHKPIMAAVQAVHDTLRALREDTPDAIPKLPSNDFMRRVTREEQYRSAMSQFMSS